MSTASGGEQLQYRNRPLACNNCRSRKIRCSRALPCANCLDFGRECNYPSPKFRIRRKEKSSAAAPSNERRKRLEERLARIETILGKATSAVGKDHANSIASLSQTLPTWRQQAETDKPGPQSRLADHSVYQVISLTHPNDCPARELLTVEGPARQAGYSPEPQETNSSLPPLAVTETGCSSTEAYPSWEYHGSTSFLSICSRPGIDWVSKRTGEPRFSGIAGSLVLGINRKLKLQRNIIQGSVPEPEPDIAWKYSKAYFENSFDAMFGVISRPAFEARLRYHLERNGLSDDDPAWYALRNTVYAFGRRIELSKASCATTLVEAEESAWQFFQKALSVHTELLYLPTGLMAVQALTAMSYFAEGIGSPSLEYMLCSCAMRLAQSKGLHRGEARAWNLPEPEQQHRNRIFWAIYLLEKHISYRSGRSSVIDDEDITCQLPITTPPTCTDDLGCFKYMVKHAQISSRITKRLATGSVFRQTPTQILQTVHELDLELQEWRDSLPSYLHPDKPISHDQFPRSLHPYHALYLRYSYFGSVMAIHSIFTLPWNNAIFGDGSLPVLHKQISLSSYIVVNAARSIILTLNCAQIDASTPTWLVLYFPLVSVINLFIYILKYPSLPTTQSDIALIEVAAGHFSRLEYASADLARPFAREITHLARAVATAAEEGKETMRTAPSPSMPRREADDSKGPNPPNLAIGSRRQMLAPNARQVDSENMVNFYSDDWSIPSLFPPPASSPPALSPFNSGNTGSFLDFETAESA